MISIILVNPQMVENIGMTARAMLNCGLTDLRIVNPRDPWPLEDWLRERLYAAASRAEAPLNGARIFTSVQEAIADLHYVAATTAQARDMVKRWVTPKQAAGEMRARVQAGQKAGVLFGPERTGLFNEDITLASDIICIPMNPDYSSLNLAQAVLVVAYEWYQAQTNPQPDILRMGKSYPAPRADLHNFLTRFEDELQTAGFFTSEEMKPTMVQNLRNALQRAELTEQEVRTLHGAVKALVQGPKRRLNSQ